MFEWLETKRLKILRDRELDFQDTVQIFDGRPALHVRSFRNNEDRVVSIAMIDSKFYAVVWTWRGENRRIISFRRARDAEERRYRKLYG
ncbi:MAG: BrnT family toxin [Stellaceae bacterium]